MASNQHGWQWSAGSGTDAALYFRIFNPTNKKLDPSGDYIRRWVTELAGVDDVQLGHSERPRSTRHRSSTIVQNAPKRCAAISGSADNRMIDRVSGPLFSFDVGQRRSQSQTLPTYQLLRAITSLTA